MLATEARELEEMPQKSQKLSQVESRKSSSAIGNSLCKAAGKASFSFGRLCRKW